MNEDRDAELGRLLEASAEPEPDEAYWRQMEANLSRDSDAGQRRANWSVLGNRRRVWATAAAVAAMAVVAAALFGLPGTGGRTGPTTATAAEVAAAMQAAATTYHTVQAEFVHTDRDPMSGTASGTYTGTMALTDRGDYRVTTFGEPGMVENTWLYDARRHAFLQLLKQTEGTRLAYREDDTVPSAYSSVGRENLYVWFVRAALLDGDPGVKVRDVVFAGRPAWSVSIPAPASSDLDSLAKVVVDRETGLLLRYEDSFQTVTYSRLRVDEALPPGLFSTRIPEGYIGHTRRADYFCSLRAVPARVGREPLLPASVPEGYSLDDVATSPQTAGSWDGWMGPDPGTHDAHEAVHLRYRRGTDAFAVDQFSLGSTPEHGKISKREVAGYFAHVDKLPTYRAVRLRGGKFEGKRAATFFNHAGANLIVHDGDLMVLISGALTRQDLVDVAESLALWQP